MSKYPVKFKIGLNIGIASVYKGNDWPFSHGNKPQSPKPISHVEALADIMKKAFGFLEEKHQNPNLLDLSTLLVKCFVL